MNDNTSRVFSDNLKKYMNLFNLNQSDVADYFGIIKSELLEEDDAYLLL